MFFTDLGYFGVFLAAFLSATVVPFCSEAVFSFLYFEGLSGWWLVLWATLGNTLGGMTCFWLGSLGKLEWLHKWFRIKKESVTRFQKSFVKYGDWFSLLAFVPGIGDFIAVGAGYMKCRWWLVMICMTVGKGLRYVLWMQLNLAVS